MNKTVTINISGIIFHIEEDAYDKLSKYLNTIKGYFSKTDGGSEIMSDIEARIAEMLQGKTSAVKQVVLMADVDAVIQAMGKPEEFAEGAAETSAKNEEQEQFESTTRIKRRLFRDPDHKAIGGVCSGIAAYFDVEIVWIRLAMFLMIFFGGLSLWVYLILWIVIPEARSTADKLAMRGEKVDINNISKTVKEEANQIKNRMENYSRTDGDKFIGFLKDIFRGIVRFMARVIGVFLILLSLVLFFALIGSFFGITVIDETNARDFISGVFNSASQKTMLIIGGTLLFGIPAIMFLYKGIKMLFRIHFHNKWLNIGAGLLWLVGLLLCACVGFDMAREFSESAHVRTPVRIQQPSGNMLVLKINEKDMMDYGSEAYYNGRHRRFVRIHRSPNWMLHEKDGKKIMVGFGSLNIIPCETDSFELYLTKSAKGPNRKSAMDRAKNISYAITQTDSVIYFNNYFTADMAEKWRDQGLEVFLKVPKNKMVLLDHNIGSFIYDIENVTNTYDGDMVGRRWIMTVDGLKCVDCEGLEDSEDESKEFKHPSIPPAPPQPPIHVGAKDADIKVGKDGINIISKEADVHVGEHGIHINTKGDKQEKGNK
jgi:phage shock protein PspC (stress-responsive transcriptional regulator)